MKNGSEIIDRFFAGETSAAARLITLAENHDPRWGQLYDRIAGKVGQAYRTGFTGPPGAGKSTLMDAMTRHCREQKKKVGLIAVDPTSPFSGGALLGDRIRMQEVQLDPDVYIRSMATRGSLGGISRATVDACDVLDAFGFEEILIETVGVGQAETDILSAADTVCVVLCPGLGDGVQAMKAGLMEIADVFVINKADLPGADKLRTQIQDALELRQKQSAWKVPIVETVATKSEGLAELAEQIQKHRGFLQDKGKLSEERAQRTRRRIQRAVEEGLLESVWEEKGYGSALAKELDRGGEVAPYALAASFLDKIRDQVPRAGG